MRSLATRVLGSALAVSVSLVPALAQPPASGPIPDYSHVEREDVPEAFRWRVEDIYESEEAWERDLARAREELDRLDGMAAGW